MTITTRARIGIIAAAFIGLSGCAGGYNGGPGYASVDVYDRYYGRSGGYRSVPYGYVGSGFGWYGERYYPGRGSYGYDRQGRRMQLSDDERRYWEGHSRQPRGPQDGHRPHDRDDRPHG